MKSFGKRSELSKKYFRRKIVILKKQSHLAFLIKIKFMFSNIIISVIIISVIVIIGDFRERHYLM